MKGEPKNAQPNLECMPVKNAVKIPTHAILKLEQDQKISGLKKSFKWNRCFRVCIIEKLES